MSVSIRLRPQLFITVHIIGAQMGLRVKMLTWLNSYVKPFGLLEQLIEEKAFHEHEALISVLSLPVIMQCEDMASECTPGQ